MYIHACITDLILPQGVLGQYVRTDLVGDMTVVKSWPVVKEQSRLSLLGECIKDFAERRAITHTKSLGHVCKYTLTTSSWGSTSVGMHLWDMLQASVCLLRMQNCALP